MCGSRHCLGFDYWTFFSNNSATDVSETCKSIFPDSQIVSSCQCGADKIKYLTNWGVSLLI